MTKPPCPTSERLTRFVDRDLSSEDALALEAHLVDCSACRSEVDALRGIVADLRAVELAGFDPAAHARAVLERIDEGERVAAADGGKVRRRMGWPAPALGLALAACAVSLLVVARVALAPVGHYQARGGGAPASIARDVGVQLYETAPALRLLAPGAAIHRDAALTAGYRNAGSEPAYLLLFAVDPAGTVHWIAPPYTDPARDPSAVTLAPNPDEQILAHTVQLEDLTTGGLRVVSVVTRTPARVSSIEALESRGVSADAITAALPHAEVREVRLEVREEQP